MNKIIVISVLLISAMSNEALAQFSRDGSFSSDGKKIVYVSAVNKNTEIFIMDTDGKNQKQLSKTGYNNFYPFLSPNDSTIVFMSYPKGKAVICLINSDGRNLRCLTDENEENADPHWSPDGSRIIFYSDKDGNGEIYTMDTTGQDLVRITYTPSNEQSPSFSPDGTKIVFVSDQDGNAEIYTMNIDGTNVRRLTEDPRSDRVPCWSPDGRKIIWYSRDLPDVAGSPEASWNTAEIFSMNADGTGRKRLTQNLFMDHGPVYSPDGMKVLFTSGRTGNREIFIIDLEQDIVTQLTMSSNK